MSDIFTGPSCSKCRFYDGDSVGASDSGLCRINPPVAVVTAGQPSMSWGEYPQAHWPMVSEADWCGKFEEKDPLQQETVKMERVASGRWYSSRPNFTSIPRDPNAATAARMAAARRVKRLSPKVGASYPFYSTLVGVDNAGILVRKYSGQNVRVVGAEPKAEYQKRLADFGEEGKPEPLFEVQAEDGVKFWAWEGELDGYYFDTGQWVGPEG